MVIPLRDFLFRFVVFLLISISACFSILFFLVGGGFVVFSFLIWPIEKQLEPAQRRRSSINLLNPGVTKVPKKTVNRSWFDREISLPFLFTSTHVNTPEETKENIPFPWWFVFFFKEKWQATRAKTKWGKPGKKTRYTTSVVLKIQRPTGPTRWNAHTHRERERERERENRKKRGKKKKTRADPRRSFCRRGNYNDNDPTTNTRDQRRRGF